ncbi:unnamed protein product [Prunus armeniaca]
MAALLLIMLKNINDDHSLHLQWNSQAAHPFGLPGNSKVFWLKMKSITIAILLSSRSAPSTMTSQPSLFSFCKSIVFSDDTLTINKLDVYEQHKELILLGERVVLATLAFDLNVNHPYKPLVEAIKKLKVAHSALAQVAWNFVNDGYGSLSLYILRVLLGLSLVSS